MVRTRSRTSRSKAQATFHHFKAVAARPGGEDTFGNEVDFKLAYSPWKNLSLDAVYALFAPGDIAKMGVLDPTLEHFFYSTADVKF